MNAVTKYMPKDLHNEPYVKCPCQPLWNFGMDGIAGIRQFVIGFSFRKSVVRQTSQIQVPFS